MALTGKFLGHESFDSEITSPVWIFGQKEILVKSLELKTTLKIKAISYDSYGLTGFVPTAKQEHTVPMATDSPARPGAGPGERGTMETV